MNAAGDEPKRKAGPDELALEKLELDNEEQRARIAQMQLKWWQKPIGLLSALVPLVPIVATGVVAIADKWSEQEREAAEVAESKADLERQNYETENQRLMVVKGATELENARLRFEQQQLTREQAALAVEVEQLAAARNELVNEVFRRYTSVCEVAGGIATASSWVAATAEFDRFTAYSVLGIDADIDPALQEILQHIETWAQQSERPEQLEGSVLKLCLACRAAFRKHDGQQFRRPVRELTVAIYKEAEALVQELEKAPEFGDAKGTIDRFWQLYYGKLILVESEVVEQAMVRAGKVLNAWHSGPPNRAALARLSGIFMAEFDRILKDLDRPENGD